MVKLWIINVCTLRAVFVGTFIVSILVLLTLLELDSILKCDKKATVELVRTPKGHYIQKMGIFHNVKLYSEISKKCRYNEQGMVDCPDVRMKGESLIRQIQLVITRMLLITDMICKKHGIKYWIISGTLIGAIRHNGFIPWDNDIDIAMLREDYEKFKKYVITDLPPDIMLQNRDTDLHFHKYQSNEAKLRDLNSCYALCLRYGCKRNDGLMLDIFVLNPGSRKNTVYNKWGRFHYKLEELFPLRNLTFEGYVFPAPQKYEKIMERQFGDIFTPLSEEYQCPTKGYIGHPWYSCKAIASKDLKERKKIIQESRISYDWILYYVY